MVVKGLMGLSFVHVRLVVIVAVVVVEEYRW